MAVIGRFGDLVFCFFVIDELPFLRKLAQPLTKGVAGLAFETCDSTCSSSELLRRPDAELAAQMHEVHQVKHAVVIAALA